ncbi:MAG: trypsin-like peptidase domain-containing protein [Hyphomicrobium sp.]
MRQSPPHAALFAIQFAAGLALAIAAVIAFSQPGHAAVFGSDTRTRLTSADTALRAQIGTLASSQSGAFCTAFCVADDLIATASHCLFGTTASPGPRLKDLTFKPGSARGAEPGTPLAGRATANQSQSVTSGTRQLAVLPPIGAVDDWAVARLDQPVCRGAHLALTNLAGGAIREHAARGHVYQIAVHADLADTDLRRAAPCAIEKTFAKADATTIARDFTAADAILFHTCDTGGGSSGSPLLIDTANGPEVVGINVGTYVLSRNVSTAHDTSAQPAAEAIANTAIDIAALQRAVTDLSQRNLLTLPTEVRALKSRLHSKGLFHGPETGIVTGDLRAAIARFEEVSGRPVTGLVRRALLAEIDAWYVEATPSLAPLPPAGTPGVEGFQALRARF